MTTLVPVAGRQPSYRRTLAAPFTAAAIALTLAGAAVHRRSLDQLMRYDEAYNDINFGSRGAGYIVIHYNPHSQILHTLLVHSTTGASGATSVEPDSYPGCRDLPPSRRSEATSIESEERIHE